jgi:hypothetical protein
VRTATARSEEVHRGRCLLDLEVSVGDESVSMAWLEEALEHAYAHRQMNTLAYVEAVMEDVVFVMEMAATRRAFTVG